jgi:hypothetical protein
LEGPYYLLQLNERNGSIKRLLHKPTGTELVSGPNQRGLAETVFWSGREALASDVHFQVTDLGPVFARLQVTAMLDLVRLTNYLTLYADLDRVDFDLRVHKPPTTNEHRLCHCFPVWPTGAEIRLETPGAIIRPVLQPMGDLVPGADSRRFAVQDFVNASLPNGPSVTIATVDAFALRMDLGAITFEALGNDQNHREVSKDQDGDADFRFRYSLRVAQGPFARAEAVTWSRGVVSPLVARTGRLPAGTRDIGVVVDPRKAIATCLKPVEDPGAEGVILRLWELAGDTSPVDVRLTGWRKAVRADLLERDQEELHPKERRVAIPMRPLGLAGLHLLK